MGTQANILIRDSNEASLIYRNSDGTPNEILPILKKTMNTMKKGEIRNNTRETVKYLYIIFGYTDVYEIPDVGANIEYLYVLDLTQNKIEVYNRPSNETELEIIKII